MSANKPRAHRLPARLVPLLLRLLGPWTPLACTQAPAPPPAPAPLLLAAQPPAPPPKATPPPESPRAAATGPAAQISARSKRMMVLVKYPDPFPSDPNQRRALFALGDPAEYKDGLELGTLDSEALSALRAAGAKVFVIDYNSNVYLANTHAMSADERVAYIDERWKRAVEAGER